MRKQLGNITIEVVEGDITRQPDVDCIVNAANAALRPGGGVAGAIHRAAGPKLDEECRPLSPIRPGEAVLTGGHSLPNRHVIHCLGPVYGRDEPSAELLGDCYRNALQLAEKNDIPSVAFPSISTGIFGYPMDEAAEIAFQVIQSLSGELSRVKLVRLVLFGEEAARVHREALQKVTS
jgi:O-acetyl-ADP-ribose deacetylase (regulator of RNase III)